MSLTLYKKKRNFKDTPEPIKTFQKKSSKLSFVVQRHNASHLHYDFRIELNGVLKSWAIPKGPSMNPSDKRLAIQVEDHPISYGNFFGIIPKGNYGAGNVEIWDKGTYKPMENTQKTNTEKLLKSQILKGDIKITLSGHYLKGSFALVRIKDGKDKNWLLIKKQDKYANDKFDISKTNSLKLLKDFDLNVDIKKSETEKKYSEIKSSVNYKKEEISKHWTKLQNPMLAKASGKIFDDPDWLFEIKYDGYRMITKISDGSAIMISRNGNSYNEIYKTLRNELEKVEDEVIIDGEVVIENQNKIPKFQLLQNYPKTKNGILKYYVFDLLFLNGKDLSGLSLINRKELLKDFFEKYKFENIFFTEYVIEKGIDLFKKLSKKGYEGVIGKEIHSQYHAGKRADAWQKFKYELQQTAVIGGYTKPQGSRKYFGSLILGVYEKKNLKYIGNCGTGFSDTSLKIIYEKLSKSETAGSPFKPDPKMKGMKGTPVWVKPNLICDVKFSEWTDDQRMRHPVFNGLISDTSSSGINEKNSI